MAYPKFLYDNRLDDATPAASSTATGDYAVANLRDWRPYTWWKPSAMPATVTVDCGSAKAADYAFIYGHDLSTQGATLEVRGSTDNFVASDVLVSSKTPTSDLPFLLTFNSVSYRYWRIKVTGSNAPSLAIAAIGAALASPVYIAPPFDPIGREVQGAANLNENGQPLGAAIDFEKWTQSVTLSNVSWSWVRSTFLPAWKTHFRSTPFGFAWESAGYPDEVLLVTGGAQLQIPHNPGSFCNVQMQLSGVIQ